MEKKKLIQKLLSFESNGKDFAAINKELLDGWRIVKTIPHPKKKNSHFCVLQKTVDNSQETNNITIKDILDIVNYNKSKDSKIEKPKDKISKILENV